MRTFAKELGCAYQITDDLRDTCVVPAMPNKTRPNLVTILGPDVARSRLRQHVVAALEQAALETASGPLVHFVNELFGPLQTSDG
jgi:hypothetical protein